jgi:hypothetical protein
MLILENSQQYQHKIRDRTIEGFESEAFRRLRKKVQERLRAKGEPHRSPLKKNFSDREAYSRQLMQELSEPKLERYNSELMSRTLRVVVEQQKAGNSREEVIIRSAASKVVGGDAGRKRKLSVMGLKFDGKTVLR